MTRDRLVRYAVASLIVWMLSVVLAYYLLVLVGVTWVGAMLAAGCSVVASAPFVAVGIARTFRRVELPVTVGDPERSHRGPIVFGVVGFSGATAAALAAIAVLQRGMFLASTGLGMVAAVLSWLSARRLRALGHES